MPYVFLSNSSGSYEGEKAAQLSTMLSREISEEQVVLATTPFFDLTPEYKHKRVLVVALHESTSHKLAKHYGLENYITIQRYAHRHPHLVPCKAYPKDEEQAGSDSEPEPLIEAVFIFEVPLDWWESIQVLVDLLRSNGRPGREHEASTQVIPVFSASADFHYGSTHSLPRLTNGAFLMCLQTIFAQATNGRTLTIQFFGKPCLPVYTCARARLEDQRRKLSHHHQQQQQTSSSLHTTIYMIGDNPHSDIKGALAAGDPWRAILVRTGCFQGGANDDEFPAHHVCENILEAVQCALGLHGLL